MKIEIGSNLGCVLILALVIFAIWLFHASAAAIVLILFLCFIVVMLGML